MKYYHRTKIIDKGKPNEWVADCGYYGSDLPLNKPVWGFAYRIDNDTGEHILNYLPTLGEICKDEPFDVYFFVPYKKGINQRCNYSIAGLNSRMYADTYEEAVEMYNELIQQRINNLKRMIDEAEKEKIILGE